MRIRFKRKYFGPSDVDKNKYSDIYHTSGRRFRVGEEHELSEEYVKQIPENIYEVVSEEVHSNIPESGDFSEFDEARALDDAAAARIEEITSTVKKKPRMKKTLEK